MKLHFEPVTEENRKDVLKLSLGDGQEGYLEPILQCLKEAAERKNWRPVGIYDGGLLIGFAMYGMFRLEYFPVGKVWLDRFMIDAAYQGRGYGTAAVKGLIKRLYREYRRRHIYLSVIPGNDCAVKLYEKCGFRLTGKRDPHGECIMVLTLS